MKYIIEAITNDFLSIQAIRMLRLSKKIIFSLCIFICICSLTFGTFNLEAFADSGKQNDQLIEKISKDFTKKFCNGIGFGLSKESAMNFANKENNLIFQNKKGFDLLNKEVIAINVANSVIDSCGYRINLKGEEGVKEIENDYRSMNNIALEEN